MYEREVIFFIPNLYGIKIEQYEKENKGMSCRTPRSVPCDI
ncbi:hypothetical protein LEP1GSC161_2728 [Leptospira santarosai str. CBC1416]|uniref:Uncharacterized protein n=1 Tax=Leptospira santarosai str. CBC1416 TaxID=1193059 RepID=M6VLL6_9LEPT|nr:hypothetical protein LEP1GSC168_3620 [Leptospira santarosai str. HAI134]EMO58382.1 hypothetical protein LEP1GSC161_2728 [Leptospira santarosai str. CBC1416]